MRVIYKFPLAAPRNEIRMPAGAEILCVQVQAGTPTLWALCTTERREVRRILRVYSTGEQMDVDAQWINYVGTVQLNDGLILHVFDAGERQA